MAGKIQTHAHIQVVTDPVLLASANHGGQPYLRISFENKVVVLISRDVAKQIGLASTSQAVSENDPADVLERMALCLDILGEQKFDYCARTIRTASTEIQQLRRERDELERARAEWVKACDIVSSKLKAAETKLAALTRGAVA